MIPTIEKLAKESKAKIGIGVSEDKRLRGRTIAGAMQAFSRGFVEPVLIGKNLPENTSLESINVENPEKELLQFIIDGKIDGGVRGSLEAGKIINEFKAFLKIDSINSSTARIALIQNNISEDTYLLAPVGIDEGHSVKERKKIINYGLQLLQLLNIDPKVSVLASGFDPEDLGRHSKADISINEANQIIKDLKDNVDISTDGILIENAIERNCNFIVNMDGVSGNLLYRSLIHVSDWKSFGVVMFTDHPQYSDKIYIDTSRIGDIHEYRRALTLASALVISQKQSKD